MSCPFPEGRISSCPSKSRPSPAVPAAGTCSPWNFFKTWVEYFGNQPFESRSHKPKKLPAVKFGFQILGAGGWWEADHIPRCVVKEIRVQVLCQGTLSGLRGLCWTLASQKSFQNHNTSYSGATPCSGSDPTRQMTFLWLRLTTAGWSPVAQPSREHHAGPAVLPVACPRNSFLLDLERCQSSVGESHPPWH